MFFQKHVSDHILYRNTVFHHLSPVISISCSSCPEIRQFLYNLNRNEHRVAVWMSVRDWSVRARAFALGYDGILHRYPRALERASPLHAPPPQQRDVRGCGRFAHHPLRHRAGALAVAAPRAHEARPEARAEVVPRVQHRAKRVGPEPHLQPALQLLAGFALLAPLRVKVQVLDVFGHHPCGVLLLEVQLLQILVAGVAVLRRAHRQKAAVKVP